MTITIYYINLLAVFIFVIKKLSLDAINPTNHILSTTFICRGFCLSIPFDRCYTPIDIWKQLPLQERPH